MVVPSCMKVVKLKPHRKYAPISRLAHEVGWKYKGIIDAMEVKRKAKSAQYFQAKQKKAVSFCIYYRGCLCWIYIFFKFLPMMIFTYIVWVFYRDANFILTEAAKS